MLCWFPLAADSESQSVDESFRFQASTRLSSHQSRSYTRPSPCRIQQTHWSVLWKTVHPPPSVFMSQNTSKLVLFAGLTVYTPLSLKPAENSSAQSRAEYKKIKLLTKEMPFLFGFDSSLKVHEPWGELGRNLRVLEVLVESPKLKKTETLWHTDLASEYQKSYSLGRQF